MRKSESDWRLSRVREGVLEQLVADLEAWPVDLFEEPGARRVLLCFSCDPFQPIAFDSGYTRAAIAALQASSCEVVTLSKAGLWAAEAVGWLRPGVDEWGATLTFVDDRLTVAVEPGAGLYADRIALLEMAKERGLKTWASLEPLTVQSAAALAGAAEYVDEFRIGLWNFGGATRETNGANLAATLEAAETLGVKYVLKIEAAQLAAELKLEIGGL
jgi:hypothetical protein